MFNVDDVKKNKMFGDYQNNTNISLLNKYVYFAVDKVANSTIKQSLFEIEYKKVSTTVLSLYDKRTSPLLSPFQVPQNLMKEVYESDEYFKFAFVRNPYSRLLSCYLDRILTLTSKPSRHFRHALVKNGYTQEQLSFESFIKVICKQQSSFQNSHWREQSSDILFDLISFDHIAKFENIWSEMEFVSQKIFGSILPEMKDRGLNKSPQITGASQKLAKFYTPELSELVYKRFKADFENFNYEFLDLTT